MIVRFAIRLGSCGKSKKKRLSPIGLSRLSDSDVAEVCLRQPGFSLGLALYRDE